MPSTLPAFLKAEWRHLAMLNYAVDPALLAPHLPAGCELDFFGGQTFLLGGRLPLPRYQGAGASRSSPPQLRRSEPALLRQGTRPQPASGAAASFSSRSWCRGGRSPGSPGPSTAKTTSRCRCATPGKTKTAPPASPTNGAAKAAGKASPSATPAKPCSPRPKPKRASSPSTTGATPASAAARRWSTR